MVLNCGTVPGIMSHIRSDKPLNYLRNLTWMISNLCRNKPAPSLALTGPLLGSFNCVEMKTFSLFIEPLNCLLAFDDVATQTDASWAISYITDSGEEHVSAVCAFDRPHSMIQQLMRNGTKDTEDKLLTPTIRALGNVVTGTDQQTQACLENVSALWFVHFNLNVFPGLS